MRAGWRFLVGAMCVMCTATGLFAGDDGGRNAARIGQREPNLEPQAAGAHSTGKRNRLSFEKSPYLLQHADNPVDWYPWSEEAFGKAKKEDKPIFLSIGYSACHWCQVMERESFEDEEVGRLLNEHFVAIKVDREERPDIDSVYMAAAQQMTGQGGWPLTILTTPEKKPFFAATYLPKRSRFGRIGLMEVLDQASQLWRKDRARVVNVSDEITDSLRRRAMSSQSLALTEEVLRKAYKTFESRFDEIHGGFGSAPKFPRAHDLLFLLRWWKRSGEAKALFMVEKTLRAMSQGGVYDHVGFGFHRYSTDRLWLIPHFEKMLYDQALIALAYSEAYQATRKAHYARVAQEVFSYVLRAMTSPEGAFYSAENADSEGEEGTFYVWRRQEITGLLGERKGDLFCRFYGVTEEGNFEDGKSVVHATVAAEEFAKREGLNLQDFRKVMEESRKELFVAREQRVHPSKDDKVLADWNGLMIAAFAKGARVFDEPEYAAAARRAADFVLSTLRREDGRLLHRYREGEAAVPGYLDDYAFLVWGLLELYEATFEATYLREAVDLTSDMLQLFWDEDRGGLYFAGYGNEKLIVPIKEAYDGAVPSGNSVAALNLVVLSEITMNQELRRKAEQLMENFGGAVSRVPQGYSYLLMAFDYARGPTKQVVIAGNPGDKDTKEMLLALRKRFLPRKVVVLYPDGDEGKAVGEIVPFVKGREKIERKATAYVCVNYACRLPTTEVSRMVSLMESP